MTSSQLYTCHTEDVQATSPLKPPVSPGGLDKISVSIICHHGALRIFHVAIDGRASIVNDVSGGRKRWEDGTLTAPPASDAEGMNWMEKQLEVSPNLHIRHVFFSLHSIDRGDTVAMGASSLSRLPQGPPPSSFFIVRPMGRTMRCERLALTARLSLHRSSPPFAASATASGTIRHVVSGIGGMASNFASPGIEWDATALAIFVSLFRSVQEGSSSLSPPPPSSSRLVTGSTVPVLSPYFQLLDEPGWIAISSFPPILPLFLIPPPL
ncbi:hypothetical protein PRIPAC_74748 [Pristionchus pacificus]|uniref:Uncharacterized protein n=1 Tax=Pristionchus pacificus TaxID=54126 RepID=A0A2A6B4V7_PRIPA|nr:hypothetical protein PRIPAC_74748 [Pristionchus pacificus]|eukprot:PDM60916.1 hypothetical protein PRIPAC_54722 [Pristionchus pacificus]